MEGETAELGEGVGIAHSMAVACGLVSFSLSRVFRRLVVSHSFVLPLVVWNVGSDCLDGAIIGLYSCGPRGWAKEC